MSELLKKGDMTERAEILEAAGILDDILHNLGINSGTCTEEEYFRGLRLIERMDMFEMLDRFLRWKGLVGWTQDILDAVLLGSVTRVYQ